MNRPEESQLGKAASYIDQYDASLLFPIPRAPKRAEIGIAGALPFIGADMWTAFELSWLNPRGKPQVALVHFTVPCETPNIVESKSFKLYLNSFNNTRFADLDAVRACLRSDLSEAVWRAATAQAHASAPPSIGVRILLPELFDCEPVHELDGLSLDRLDVACDRYTPAPDLLRGGAGRSAGQRGAGEQPAQEQLPGDRAARLGQRADQLQRRADRPGKPAAVHRELPQPQRVS